MMPVQEWELIDQDSKKGEVAQLTYYNVTSASIAPPIYKDGTAASHSECDFQILKNLYS